MTTRKEALKLPQHQHFYYSPDDTRSVRKPLPLYTADQMCEYAAAAIKEALKEHAMRETQRLGQEIEQDLKIKTTDPFESSRVADYNRGWNDCLFASGVVKQTEQEPVAWQFFQGGKWHNGMEFHDHRKHTIAAGTPVRDLYTAPPQRTWVGLTEDDKVLIKHDANFNQFMTAGEYADRVQALTEAKLKEKNT